MGGGASTAAILEEESRRPLDASDLGSPRGDGATAAKNEVIRLRRLLATHYNHTVNDMISEYDKYSEQQQQQQGYTSFQESEQQTDESLILMEQGCENEQHHICNRTAEDAATTLKLAPGIQEYLIAVFTAADLDNSGVLSSEEFTRLLRDQVDLGLSPEDIQLLHAQARWMDAKGDVTWQQFVHMAPQLLANLVDTSSTTPSATDWCSCITTEGTPYYYNKRTQESVWDRPDALLAASDSKGLTYDEGSVAEDAESLVQNELAELGNA
uniref:Uncharacterized protein n=1 Tax=Globisporangium ultimum (strain ATCC 200006 / CBS 805.95 / DAOM BR144) TaxID=431595 RepID=K3WQZ3_GLOUD